MVVKYYDRWFTTENIEFDKTLYMEAFSNVYICTKVTKYRDFQYRLLIGKIITNRNLFEWNLIESPLCTFCNDQIETTTHLLFECSVTNEVVNKFFDWCENNQIVINHDVNNFLMNRISERKTHIVNFAAVVLKQFVYKMRCSKRIPNFHQFLVEIESQHLMEYVSAKRKCKLTKHIMRWNPIINFETTHST